MSEFYCRVHDLVCQYCDLLTKGKEQEKDCISDLLTVYTNSNLNDEYYIVCSLTEFGEMVYITFDNDYPALMNFANRLCRSRPEIHAGIFHRKNGMICESSPLGMVPYEYIKY